MNNRALAVADVNNDLNVAVAKTKLEVMDRGVMLPRWSGDPDHQYFFDGELWEETRSGFVNPQWTLSGLEQYLKKFPED